MLTIGEQPTKAREISREKERQPSFSTTLGNPFVPWFSFTLEQEVENYTELNQAEFIEIKNKLSERQLWSSERELKRSPNNSYLLNNLGLGLLNAGEFSEAIKCFEKALSNREDFLQAKFNLAKAQLADGNTEAALAIYAQLLSQYPKNALVHRNLAQLYISLSAKSRSPEFLENALEHLKYVDAKEPSVQNDLGLIEVLKNNYRKAISHFRKALLDNPRASKIHVNLAACFVKTRNFRKAVNHFMAGLTLDRHNAQIAIALAKCYQELGEYLKVLSLLSKYKEEAGGNLDYWILLANSNYYLGKYKRSLGQNLKILEMLEVSHAFGPLVAQTYNNIGCAYLALRDDVNAKAYYLKSIEVSPPEPAAFFNLAYYNLNRNRLEDVASLLSSIKKFFPAHKDLPYLEARCFFKKEDYKKSLEYLDQAISINPKAFEPYATMSYILAEIFQDFNEAINLIKKGLFQSPSNLTLLNNLAYYYLMKGGSGDIKRAREILDGIKDPKASNFPYLNATRGLLLLKENSLEEASRYYRMGISQANDEETRALVRQKKNLEFGRYWLQKENVEQAMGYFRKVISINSFSNIFRTQAEALLQSGEVLRKSTPKDF